MIAEIGNMYLNNDNKTAIPGQDPELDAFYHGVSVSP